LELLNNASDRLAKFRKKINATKDPAEKRKIRMGMNNFAIEVYEKAMDKLQSSK
jgi:hypothetical protein